MKPEHIINVVMNVSLIATFIGVFFFTYVKTVEKQIVQSQSEMIADEIADDISIFLDKPTAQKLASNIPLPDLSEADKAAKKSNDALQLNASKILAIICLCGLAISYYFTQKYKLDFMSILRSNLIILTGVALTEYVFVTYILQQFVSADPNFVRYKVIDTIQKRYKLQDKPTSSLNPYISEALQAYNEISRIKQNISQNDITLLNDIKNKTIDQREQLNTVGQSDIMEQTKNTIYTSIATESLSTPSFTAPKLV